jgi:MFS family permease
MNAKLKTDALDLTSLLNGLVFFSPVSLLVRTTAGISLSQFFILQAIMATMVLLTEIPLGKLTDRIGYKSTLVLYQIALLISRTCLLLAHVSCNYSLFILQAILEGTEDEDVQKIKGKELDFAALTRFAIDFSDGVVQSSKNINSEVLKYIGENNSKFLEFQDPEDYADDYVRFYDSLM